MSNRLVRNAPNNDIPFSHLLLDLGSDETFFGIYVRSGRFSLRLFYVGAAIVLFCLQESCCYVAIFSMRALRPRFHANSVFLRNRRIYLNHPSHVSSVKTADNDVKDHREIFN